MIKELDLQENISYKPKTIQQQYSLDLKSEAGSKTKWNFVETDEFSSYLEFCQVYSDCTYCATGRNHLIRENIVIDIDKSQPLEELISIVINDLKIVPSYGKHHNDKHQHNQIGFILKFPVPIKQYIGFGLCVDTEYHQRYLKVLRVLAKHFGGDTRYSGWKCQNPAYNDSEYQATWYDCYRDESVTFEELEEACKKLPEWDKVKDTETYTGPVEIKEALIGVEEELIESDSSKRKYVAKYTTDLKKERKYIGVLINGVYFFPYDEMCDFSRHKWTLLRTIAFIITWRNLHINEIEAGLYPEYPTYQEIFNGIYGKWPKSYDKSHPYTVKEAITDIQSVLRSFKPREDFKTRGKGASITYTKEQRQHSLENRQAKALIKVYDMICLTQTGKNERECQDLFDVSEDYFRKYKDCSKNQIKKEFLRVTAGLRDWGSEQDLVFENLVKNIKNISHCYDLQEALKKKYRKDCIKKHKEEDTETTPMEKIYTPNENSKFPSYLACVRRVRRLLRKNPRNILRFRQT